MSSFTTHEITQYGEEIYVAFQNKGGVMKPRTRRKTGVIGNTYRFPKISLAGSAMQKTRNGKVPLMDILRDKVEVTLADWYGADMIDSLDELKTNVDQRGVTVDAIAMSLARKEDDLCTAAMAANTNSGRDNTATTDNFTTDAVPRQIMEGFGNAEAFNGGKMHALVNWGCWNDLLGLNSFINSDYGGDTALTSEGQRPKLYFGFDYSPFSRLPAYDADENYNLFWHHDTVGVAVGQEIVSSVDRLPEYDAWFMMGKLSQGATVIDSNGVVKRRYAM